MIRLVRRPARFARDQRGSATVEFALLAPAFLFLFLSCFESGMLLVRQVMLDRALDLTVREVRLSLIDIKDHAEMHEALKARMCEMAMASGTCMTDLKLEMQPVDPRAWSMIGAEADCVDRADDASLVPDPEKFRRGESNQLMVLRACELFDPFFPTVGLGAQVAGPAGYYGLVSTTAYVIEPEEVES